MLAADGPRYKAIGNSMAIPVMRWIGDRNYQGCMSAEMKGMKQKSEKLNQRQNSNGPYSNGLVENLVFWNKSFAILPEGNRLIEPFVGGGAVFMNAGYQENLLNDVNADLINFYKTLQREEHSLITLAHRFFLDYNTPGGILGSTECV